nr:hypothetical protein [Tanacetum cinerariifolium]
VVESQIRAVVIADNYWVRANYPDAVAGAGRGAGRNGGRERAIALSAKRGRANADGRGKRAAGVRELRRNGVAAREGIARHREADGAR